MLHDRIVILVQYVADALDGQVLAYGLDILAYKHHSGKVPKNHEVLRALAALVASLPASENSAFRDEFNMVCSDWDPLHDICCDRCVPFQEYADVQLTSYLSSLTKSASILNDVRDICPS
jgi:COP9 signalosome complex subunit 6